jgi:hypothetical protein
MKKMRRPPTTAFLRGRFVKRDQEGPGMLRSGEVNALNKVCRKLVLCSPGFQCRAHLEQANGSICYYHGR